jgi:hypothetical protein
MPKRKFKMTLKVKGCDKSFGNDLPPGVLVEQELTFDLPGRGSADRKYLLAKELVDQEYAFRDEFIEVVTEEIRPKYRKCPHCKGGFVGGRCCVRCEGTNRLEVK